ncbi:DUF937 domain-containing protein [Streptomyces cavernae]|uniref:DUF937 domain-containing protein n=1 Tax=Streptomyces cavernae TaxID=2259034 RepID=UPI000FEBFCB0|nr:DUF937 domain-containing protein [Streptomyces cavernae]
MSPMSEDSLENDVRDTLDDEKLQEIADVIGTDPAAAQEVVDATVSALSGGLHDRAVTSPGEVQQALAEVQEAPLGGLDADGLMGGLLYRVSGPAAHAAARRTGLAPETVSRVIELLMPVLLTVLSRRAARGARR